MNRESSKLTVLYHAISSYQLLEVMLHRHLFHPSDHAALLLPDFITDKYPQWQSLAAQGFFDRVQLFPYQQIPHETARQVLRDTARSCRRLRLSLRRFDRLYIAGAHFYFTLYVLKKRRYFYFLEDAPGMLRRPTDLYRPLRRRYPLQAALARRYGLFTADNPYVLSAICDPAVSLPGRSLCHFSVEDALSALPPAVRERFVRFFMPRPLTATADSILLTQHFSNLGILLWPQQEALYRRAAETLRHVPLMIKRHPDDRLDYRSLFPGAQMITQPFPSELLPYVFDRPPRHLYTFSSTGALTLRRHMHIHYLTGEEHASPIPHSC